MDILSDPKGDRIVKSVKAPPHRPLATNLMFPDKLKSILIFEKINLIGDY